MLKPNEYIHDGKTIYLTIPADLDTAENIFSVIIGKNGIGKSRFLSEIAKSTVDNITNRHNHSKFRSVIAVSTSPFDKFPSAPRRRGDLRQQISNSPYRYIGMRGEGIFPVSSALSMISSASRGLLENLLSNRSRANLIDVFNSLSFFPKATFVFKPSYLGSNQKDEDLRAVDDLSLAIQLECLARDYDIHIGIQYQHILEEADTPTRHQILNAITVFEKFIKKRKAIGLSIDFETGQCIVEGVSTNESFVHSLLILMQASFVRLMDLKLEKLEYGELSVKRASSGEQCLLVLILGIAGHIENGSLILIDEPEISLHPKWQEEFIKLLMSSFSAYQNCHFVIATHSPQIVSRLDSKACFITSLSKQRTYKASEFSHRSADFQLAELFEAPGLMNEYISRLAFSLLAKIKARKDLDSELQRDLAQLQQLAQKVDKADPIKDLVDSVVEVCRFYANDK